MSDTPRTDAACEGVPNQNRLSPFVPASVARNLERELNEAKQHCANWEDTAALHLCNESFLRDLLIQIGEPFGATAKTSNDGSIQQDVLLLKVPKLVSALRAERDALQIGCDSAKRDASEWFGKWEVAQANAINLRAELACWPGLYKGVEKERDTLRAEVERVTKERDEALRWARERDQTIIRMNRDFEQTESDAKELWELMRMLDRSFGCGHAEHGTEDCRELVRHVDETIAEREKLRAQLAAARADSERLDWLEAKGKSANGMLLEILCDKFTKKWGFGPSEECDSATLRAAIDSAKETQP